MRLIERIWFEGHSAKWFVVPLLFPLTVLFYVITAFRRWCYKVGLKRSFSVTKPVIIVGNIGVGGNGKTPLTLFLIEQLQHQGINVGVVSRGYGGNAPYYPYILSDESTAKEAGDEPLLIYRRTGVKVVVGPDRVAAAKRLIEQGCDLVLADDGLQHLRLARDYEIVVVDGKRMFGNQLLLPSGPLRESTDRLSEVDCVVVNGQLQGSLSANFQQMTLAARHVVNIATGKKLTIGDFIEQYPQVNAIAGIGDPKRFFRTLEDNGFAINEARGFVDHQAFEVSMFEQYGDVMPLLMTEKDAVKCLSFAQPHWWYLTVDANITSDSQDQLIHDILKLIKN